MPSAGQGQGNVPPVSATNPVSSSTNPNTMDHTKTLTAVHREVAWRAEIERYRVALRTHHKPDTKIMFRPLKHVSIPASDLGIKHQISSMVLLMGTGGDNCPEVTEISAQMIQLLFDANRKTTLCIKGVNYAFVDYRTDADVIRGFNSLNPKQMEYIHEKIYCSVMCRLPGMEAARRVHPIIRQEATPVDQISWYEQELLFFPEVMRYRRAIMARALPRPPVEFKPTPGATEVITEFEAEYNTGSPVRLHATSGTACPPSLTIPLSLIQTLLGMPLAAASVTLDHVTLHFVDRRDQAYNRRLITEQMSG